MRNGVVCIRSWTENQVQQLCYPPWSPTLNPNPNPTPNPNPKPNPNPTPNPNSYPNPNPTPNPNPDQVQKLCYSFEERGALRGERLQQQGQPPRFLYLVSEGE